MNLKYLIFLASSLIFLQVSAQQIDMKKLEDFKPRSIGPAAMSGRVTAIAVVNSNPDIIYVGSASGGVWKSVSGGIFWEPVFDKEPVQSIGCISIFQKNPDIIWVGTGEGNPRNSVSSGSGVYRSLDAGKTWDYMGLEFTRNIHRIIVDPDNPDIVYVGAIGFPWSPSAERGVFKTTDGGKTWSKILYINPTTGVGDMVMDPFNPNKIFVSMWDHQRWPWFFRSGGPGSGLYLTIDGGKNWKKITSDDGLPKGELGRIGIAIARGRTNVVYALVESTNNAIYRSDDGGYKWVKASERNPVERPFYFAEIYVDPQNENRVYNLQTAVSVSEDGARTFRTLIPGYPRGDIHVDNHAWYVHPENPDYLIDGNDGGLAISRDRGKTWQYVENLPFGQYYHINVDNDIPYHVYGGMQDNGSWRGPGYAWKNGSLLNGYWQEVCYGDGFDVVPDPSDSRYGYAMSQEGNVIRYDVATGYSKYIRPIHPKGLKLRFNWNAAIAQDPFDAGTIYFGSQFVHKSTNRGDSWTIISPDLTTNNPLEQKQDSSGGLTPDVTGAENHTTIICIAPSKVKQGIIWAGTDDGNVQLTLDGGKSWTNMTSRIKDLPSGCWIPQIQPSTYKPEEAVVVANNYRQNDWNPYVFRTRDAGKTWERIVAPNQVSGYALSFLQDPVEPNLFFLGTEFGLYFSLNQGKSWTKWNNGYPSVSTMDMTEQTREGDLVIGTFGRSAYIFDDIRPLRELASRGAGLLDSTLHLFAPPDAWIAEFQQHAGPHDIGDAVFTGENKPSGAMISFSVKDTAGKQKVTMEVLNQKRQVIRTIRFEPKPGFNRFQWGLDRKGPRYPGSAKPGKDENEPGGITVLPGDYIIRLSYKGKTDSAPVVVHSDPRIQPKIQNLEASNLLMDSLNHYSTIGAEAYDQVQDAKKAVDIILSQLQDDTTHADLKKATTAMKDSIQSLSEMFTGKHREQGLTTDENVVTRYYWDARQYIGSGYDVPGDNARIAVSLFRKDMERAVSRINNFFENSWKPFQKKIQNAQITPFKAIKSFTL